MSAYLLQALLSSIGAETALRVGLLGGYLNGPILSFLEGALGGLVGSAIGIALLQKEKSWRSLVKDTSSITASAVVPGIAAVLSELYPGFLPVPRYILILVFQIMVNMIIMMV